MSFITDLKKDLIAARKAKDTVKKDNLCAVIGEFERQTQKEFSEAEVQQIIKSMIKLEKEKMESVGETTSSLLDFLQTFMPEQVSEEDVKAWIVDNIDFTQFKNKMQAMGPIMKNFGNSVDGKTVKSVLASFNEG